MFRRIACLILVPALLANQAVFCCAHAHAGSELSEHSPRAHVHHSGHSHHSSHNHGDSGDHQHDDSDPTGDPASISGLKSVDPVGHDHDAIYLGEQVDLSLPASRVSIEESTANDQWLVVENPLVIERGHRCPLTRVGPIGLYCIDHCAIFLQTCRLLI